MNIKDVKRLKEETGAGILDAKTALEEFGSYDKAKAALVSKGLAKAAKKQSERTVKDGLVHAYIHAGGKVGALVTVACETDFVAKTDQFQELCHNLALQICSGEYATLDDLLADDYLKDPSRKVKDIVADAIAKVGEKIEILKFTKMSVKDLC